MISFLAACSGAVSAANDTQNLSNPYLIEPTFKQFYDFLGARDRLGMAISPTIVEDGMQKQYFENAVLFYNLELPASEQYGLVPIGTDLGVWDEPLTNADLTGAFVVEGYIIYEGFVELYKELGGQRYVGRPLTGVRYIAAEQRVEQYFENLGFYAKLNKPEEGVRLMAYGSFACAGTCAQEGLPAIEKIAEIEYGEPFISAVEHLGEDFVGVRLAGPFQSADGTVEVVYENLVLYVSPSAPDRAIPRPILSLLGTAPEALVARLDNPNVRFYVVHADLGYNVPVVFHDYIEEYGGYEIFGQPISEVKLMGDGNPRQCFANTCLTYLGDGIVALLPLGLEYKNRFYHEIESEIPHEQQEEIRIRVWEEHSQISSREEQVIYASVFAGTKLLPGLRPYIELSLPDGGTRIFQFPPTNENGLTELTVPIVFAQNGTLVPYKVCLEGFGVSEVCANESYMIWGN
ncbi:MAG: hypothetical protein ACRDFQ_02260 [Anaerolineales bacterium]